LVRVRRGLDLPGARLARVVGERAVGAGSEHREVGVWALGELDVALPSLGRAGELLLARRGEGTRAGVEVGALAGRRPARLHHRSPRLGVPRTPLDGLLGAHHLLVDDLALAVAG